ncbi:MAG: PhzF family phenazine biosynthesis protein [Nitrospiria bacterium]
MSFQLFQVDAFSNKPFGGNPAAVCFLSERKDAAWMRQVAAEMNLSETAFLKRKKRHYDLRWFTPVAEVDLCGHATLASAHVLWETAEVRRQDAIRFETRSGLLTAARQDEWIEIDLPADTVRPVTPPPGLIRALGLNPVFCGRTRFDFLIEVETEQALRAIKPDFPLLAAAPARGVIVTSRAADAAYDFVSRFFSPRYGIDEDPVTGSSHCALGPYWKDRLCKDEMAAYQASARGGVLRVRPAQNRVFLKGKAVTVFRGMML